MSEAQFQGHLARLFGEVHKVLQKPIEVQCRGVFLDSLTTNAHGKLTELASLYQRHGNGFDQTLQPMEDLVLCPKPHVAPWRLDLVSSSRDCCTNPAICHIAGLRPN